MKPMCCTCGAADFKECLALCSQCKSSREHVYCMKTSTKDVPDDWICDHCLLVNQEDFSRHDGSKVGDHSGNEKKPTHRTVLLSHEEVIASNSTLIQNTRSEPHQISDTKSHTIRGSNLKRQNLTLLIGGSGPGTKGQPRKRVSLSAERTAIVVNKATSANQSQVHGSSSTGTGLCFHKVSLPRSKNVEDLRLANTQPELDKYIPNQPALFATWKGSFRIRSDQSSDSCDALINSCDALIAYPPAKVARKAYEFSKTMPETLEFKIVSRCSLWAGLFDDEGPDKFDIGLYFFPIIDHRSEQTYDFLVEQLMKRDMVMKSCIRGVELFVLPSKLLDKESQKINQAHFLWGLFRPSGDDIHENITLLMHPEIQCKQVDDVHIRRPPIEESTNKAPKEQENEAVVVTPAGLEQQPVVKVKPQRTEVSKLGPLPRFTASVHKKWEETREVPPGFEGAGRVKYKSMSQIIEGERKVNHYKRGPNDKLPFT